MDKKIDYQNGRFYNYNCITYLSEEEINYYMATNNVKHYAYIKHDKCKLEDGTDEQTHYHLLIVFRNARSLKAVQRSFPSRQNTRVEVMLDIYESFVYLDHKYEADERKYKYSHDDIKSDDITYWDSLGKRGEMDDKTICIINDVMNRVHPRELLRRYGRDIVMNYEKYRYFAGLIISHEIEQEKELVLCCGYDTGEVVLSFDKEELTK